MLILQYFRPSFSYHLSLRSLFYLFLVAKKQVLLYSKLYEKRQLSKRPLIGFQDQISLNAGQRYCRMLPLELPLEHSAILLTFIKLPFVIKIFFVYLFKGRFTQVLLYLEGRFSHIVNCIRKTSQRNRSLAIRTLEATISMPIFFRGIVGAFMSHHTE